MQNADLLIAQHVVYIVLLSFKGLEVSARISYQPIDLFDLKVLKSFDLRRVVQFCCYQCIICTQINKQVMRYFTPLYQLQKPCSFICLLTCSNVCICVRACVQTSAQSRQFVEEKEESGSKTGLGIRVQVVAVVICLWVVSHGFPALTVNYIIVIIASNYSTYFKLST